jgi:ABC-type spermidine/putrescine transport system permease subunit I
VCGARPVFVAVVVVPFTPGAVLGGGGLVVVAVVARVILPDMLGVKRKLVLDPHEARGRYGIVQWREI